MIFQGGGLDPLDPHMEISSQMISERGTHTKKNPHMKRKATVYINK